MTPQERELREQWHVRTVNMAQEVIDYSKVEGMIADWWVGKLSKALDTKRNEIVEAMDRMEKEVETDHDDYPKVKSLENVGYNRALRDLKTFIQNHESI